MNQILWILSIIICAMLIYMLGSMLYTFVTMYNQTKIFINNLKVGDETEFGKISELDGDYVIIKRQPLKIHRSDIRPTKFKANKLFFMLAESKLMKK